MPATHSQLIQSSKKALTNLINFFIMLWFFFSSTYVERKRNYETGLTIIKLNLWYFLLFWYGFGFFCSFLQSAKALIAEISILCRRNICTGKKKSNKAEKLQESQLNSKIPSTQLNEIIS